MEIEEMRKFLNDIVENKDGHIKIRVVRQAERLLKTIPNQQKAALFKPVGGLGFGNPPFK